MKNDGRYVFKKDRREAYEALQAPFAVFQYVGGKVVTLLVTDGLCVFQGETRDVLTEHFDTCVFKKVHPDDVQRLAQEVYKFALQEGKYDVVYQARLYGKDEYRYVHAISKYHVMEDGSQVAFTHYEDITEAVQSLVNSAQNTEMALTKFLDEHASAMIIMTCKSERLCYYNKAAVRMLKPKVIFDTAMTFQQFFYSDIPNGMVGLLSHIDMGTHIVEEPRTHRKLEVKVVSTTWDKEAAYAIYFYEFTDANDKTDISSDLRHKREAFHDIMFNGPSNDKPFWQDGYTAFRLWNITKNCLALDEGYNFLKGIYGDALTYSSYLHAVLEHVPRLDEHQILKLMEPENLPLLYETDNYPRSFCFRMETTYGHIDMQTSFRLMRSPDTGDLYLKVSEENISQRIIKETMFQKALEKEYDYIAYFDGKADTCRIVLSTATSPDQRDRLVSIEDYLINFREQIGTVIRSATEFIDFIMQCCYDNSEYVYTYNLPNGQVKSICIQLLDRENKLFFAYRTDVTRLLRKEHDRVLEIERLKDEAEAANQKKSLFLSSMSHDLRTPLNGIIGFTELALQDQDMAKKQEYLGKVKIAGELLLDIINDTLELSRIESGKLLLKPEPVDGNQYWESVVTALQPAAAMKNVHLTMDFSAYPHEVIKVDRVQVKKVLLNLISNAIKYTPAGGNINVSVQVPKPPVAGYTHRIVVEDTGIGMSEEFMTHMYEPFSQEQRPEAKNVVGTGLGLAIVKRIVDFMNGQIKVQSKINTGTRFVVDLPIEHWAKKEDEIKLKQEEERKQQTIIQAKLSHKNVLLCEDNELNAEIATLLLKNKKMHVDWCENGQEALAALQASMSGYYDLVLMDVRMPVMDGYAATRAIRKLEREDLKNIPVIAMTANAFEEDIKEAEAAGMNDYATKPVNPSALFATLAKYIK